MPAAGEEPARASAPQRAAIVPRLVAVGHQAAVERARGVDRRSARARAGAARSRRAPAAERLLPPAWRDDGCGRWASGAASADADDPGARPRRRTHRSPAIRCPSAPGPAVENPTMQRPSGRTLAGCTAAGIEHVTADPSRALSHVSTSAGDRDPPPSGDPAPVESRVPSGGTRRASAGAGSPATRRPFESPLCVGTWPTARPATRRRERPPTLVAAPAAQATHAAAIGADRRAVAAA